jgi:hypothetical protein
MVQVDYGRDRRSRCPRTINAGMMMACCYTQSQAKQKKIRVRPGGRTLGAFSIGQQTDDYALFGPRGTGY